MIHALILIATTAVSADPSTFEEVAEGVYCVRDDAGQWSGDLSKAITHQSKPEYQAKKILDLTNVPAEVWEAAQEVRLSMHFSLRDHSWNVGDGTENGLDEGFVILINGTETQYPTDCGAPSWSRVPKFGWHDFILPREQFTRGENEIIVRKAPSEKNDDYVYMCIDTTVEPKNSYVDFGGGEWRQDALTIPGGAGEYMIRLYLIARELGFSVTWQPGSAEKLDDAAGLLLYHGSRDGDAAEDGLRLVAGESARLEWRPEAIDQQSEMSALVEASGEVDCAWLDETGAPGEAVRGDSPYFAPLPAGRRTAPSGFVISAADGPVTLTKVTLRGAASYLPLEEPVDMAPPSSDPAGEVKARPPRCTVAGDTVLLENSTLACRFSTAGDRLRMESLRNEWTGTEMLRNPEAVSLLLVEVGEQRYAGSREFALESIDAGETGFTAQLELAEPRLNATLQVGIEDEGLRMGLELANAGAEPVDFKVAFPHLAGLGVSETAEADYYFYPWGGGIFSDRPARIRRGYGDHEAMYQLMDIYSPELGGGLAVRADDADGWHKILALRKHIPGKAEFGGVSLTNHAEDQYQWSEPLDAVEGIGLAFEYQRRTRAPGDSFAPADAVLAAHAGDWKTAMQSYREWAHEVWSFRDHPTRLGPVVNMIAAGWGQSPLFKDGAYRTDYIKPMTDCIELMSWWDWSALGPWRTPLDEYKEKYGEAKWKQWQPYFVEDPVTGQLMWNNQPGDYDGYNERFGGLPTFREAIEMYKGMGSLTTLYTDPFRMDDGSKIGRLRGEEWGVVTASGEHSKGYDVWNPCHDNPDCRAWVADAMERVMRETGADGIRLDEYGHRGFVCHSDRHEHTYQEPGITQWQKGVAETTRMVRERMDRVDPTSVLTTEHPGYDYLMQYIDGCITYDLTVQKTELRPLEVNLQRFYFPECKAYELDHRGADVEHKKRFWNAVASFGSYYPRNMYNVLLENPDVFEVGEGHPLNSTLARRVYVNRFTGGRKKFYMLYNATGHTFEGTVLELLPLGDRHALDVLRCKPADAREEGLHIYLPRDGVACIAILRRQLSVARDGDRLSITVEPRERESSLAICDLAGETLLSQGVTEGEVIIDLSELEGEPACVKLLAGGLLLDMWPVP